MASPGTPRVLSRWHSSVYVSEGQAAVELFFRLNHARQTMAYVRHQVAPRSCRMLRCKATCRCVGSRCADESRAVLRQPLSASVCCLSSLYVCSCS